MIRKWNDGWVLTGFAAFFEQGVTGLHYRLELDSDYSTLRARIEGFREDRAVAHEFRREGAWYLDGTQVAGLDDLVHLDFGFTPATNLQQLRHAGLAEGEEADIPAAWFDIGEPTLVRLPQHYRRLADDRYQYDSPTASYSAVLELAHNGFVRLYPGLWEMEEPR
ncbi:putative glycolipid-binding domain-containing protein [Sphingomonas sp. NSE70-1]|uniref:Glycolipid-binding domain-containing protein n=1 Tax=Sphingomonas caseinilyticus TaxID=2908205 RepID=A0ABT0RRS4_9SPHN|nr:putative glycolipid-binding domain-containing protein [Sphingomonas caseinilyticus]